MQHFDYVPHPWVAQRAHHKPPQTADEHIGFNGQLAAGITKAVGTMWAVYIALGIQIIWIALATIGLWVFAKDPYPFAFLLFLGNIIQLLLMFVILVGQQVLGGASDKRAVQTYKDAEAILQECLKLQEHLMEQDKVLARILDAWPQQKGA